MKVLLRDDVDGVGRRGDIVNVAGGFARNFLLPEGRAIVATDGVEGQADPDATRPRPARGARTGARPRPRRPSWPGPSSPSRPGPAAAGGSSAPSAPADVVEAVRTAKGVEIDRKHVLLADPIKEVGTFDVTVDLFSGVATVVTLEVTAAS